MKKYFCATFLLLTSFTFFAQTTTPSVIREKFFTQSIGFSHNYNRDNLMSPLTYSGYGFELHTGAERISEKWYKKFDLWGNFSQFQSRVENGYNYTANGIHWGVSQIWARRVMPSETRFRWYVGGGVFHDGSINIRGANTNNSISYNLPTGLEAATFLAKNVRIFKLDWVLSTQFSLPFLAYNARPSYIGTTDTENFTQQYGIVTLNKLLMFDWRWQIDRPLSNGNRLRAIYRWNYVDDKHSGRLQEGSQVLSLEMLFNIPFRKKKSVDK